MLIMNLSSTDNSFNPGFSSNDAENGNFMLIVDRFSHSHPPPAKAKDSTCSDWDAMGSDSTSPTFSHFLSRQFNQQAKTQVYMKEPLSRV